MKSTKKKKRGPKPRPAGTTTSKFSGRRNVTLAREDADRLNAAQERLIKVFGFRPTLPQTVTWLIQNHPLAILRERDTIRDPRLKLDDTEDGPMTVIAHPFTPRDPPNAHQCSECGWPAANHIR